MSLQPTNAAGLVGALSLVSALSLVTACGSRSEDVDTKSDRHPSRSDGSEAADAAVGNSQPSNSGADGGVESSSDKSKPASEKTTDADDEPIETRNEDETGTAESDPDDDRTQELADAPSVDPLDSDLHLPRCVTPTDAEFGFPTYGTEAVRLHWKPETGECEFTSGDGSPEGWSGILTLRRRGDDTFLSGIGRWRYYAPLDLDLDDLPEGETITFYPYLDDWQFVADVRYNGQEVRIERFEYIEGDPPADYGVPDEHSNDPPTPESNLVPCSSLSGGDDGHDSQTAAAQSAGGSVGRIQQAACLSEPPPPPTCDDGSVTIPYPAGTELTDFTLIGTDILELRDVTVPGSVANLGLSDTVIFSGATIGNVYSRGVVDLRSGATVTGFIKTTTQEVVQGSANYDPNLVDHNYNFDPEQTVTLCFPEPDDINQGPNIFVDVGETESHPPGTYNNIELRPSGRLRLSPGVYWADSLLGESSAIIEIVTTGCTENCAVILNVRSEIEIPLRATVTPPGSNFLLNYHGTIDATVNVAFDGFFLALNATLQLNNDVPRAGAFFAKRLFVDAGQDITHRPFPIELFDAWSTY